MVLLLFLAAAVLCTALADTLTDTTAHGVILCAEMGFPSNTAGRRAPWSLPIEVASIKVIRSLKALQYELGPDSGTFQRQTAGM